MERRKEYIGIAERVAAIETAIKNEGGILYRLKHIDECVDHIKRTIWIATGCIITASALLKLFL